MSSTYVMQNIMRQEAQKAMNSKTFSTNGKVIGYDPNKFLARVELYPADEATGEPALQPGWLPIYSPWVGVNCGMFCAPNIGDIVEVHFQEGSLQNGYICSRNFNNISPPLPIPSGEFWLVHASGSFIKLLNDGTVEINSQKLELGVVSDALLKLMNSVARDVFNEHTHMTPDGESDPPTQQMGDDSLTLNTTAN